MAPAVAVRRCMGTRAKCMMNAEVGDGDGCDWTGMLLAHRQTHAAHPDPPFSPAPRKQPIPLGCWSDARSKKDIRESFSSLEHDPGSSRSCKLARSVPGLGYVPLRACKANLHRPLREAADELSNARAHAFKKSLAGPWDFQKIRKISRGIKNAEWPCW